jgi:hypothetical protein
VHPYQIVLLCTAVSSVIRHQSSAGVVVTAGPANPPIPPGVSQFLLDVRIKLVGRVKSMQHALVGVGSFVPIFPSERGCAMHIGRSVRLLGNGTVFLIDARRCKRVGQEQLPIFPPLSLYVSARACFCFAPISLDISPRLLFKLFVDKY